MLLKQAGEPKNSVVAEFNTAFNSQVWRDNIGFAAINGAGSAFSELIVTVADNSKRPA